MGRTKQYTNEILEEYYRKIVDTLRKNDGFVYSDELSEKTGLNKAQIGKALQFGRRNFDGNLIPITDYVMASPTGYFLPTRGQEVIAYVVQVTLDARSRARTLKPIFEYANHHWGNQLQDLLNNRLADETETDDEMHPWEVFEQIMNLKGGNNHEINRLN